MESELVYRVLGSLVIENNKFKFLGVVLFLGNNKFDVFKDSIEVLDGFVSGLKVG